MIYRIDPTWHAFGGALCLLLFILRRWAIRTSIILVFLVEWPGVLLHELIGHLLPGLIFRAEPYGFNLLPERSRRDGGWILGSVEFGRITAFNAVPIALGPLFLLVIAYEVFTHWYLIFPCPTLLNTLGLYASVFTLSYSSIPSRQDIRVATNWRSLALYGSIAVLWIGWHYRTVLLK